MIVWQQLSQYLASFFSIFYFHATNTGPGLAKRLRCMWAWFLVRVLSTMEEKVGPRWYILRCPASPWIWLSSTTPQFSSETYLQQLWTILYQNICWILLGLLTRNWSIDHLTRNPDPFLIQANNPRNIAIGDIGILSVEFNCRGIGPFI